MLLIHVLFQILVSIQPLHFDFFFPVTGLGQIFRNLNYVHNIINYFLCCLYLMCIIILDNMSSAPLLDDMSSAPLLDDVSSTPLPDDMSSALQRNRSYLFEVSEATNRSTRQLVWFIWLFDWLVLVPLTFWLFQLLELESNCK